MVANSPLSCVSFANIFSYYLVCLLILVTLFSAEHKFSTLMKSSLSSLYFINRAYSVVGLLLGCLLGKHIIFPQGFCFFAFIFIYFREAESKKIIISYIIPPPHNILINETHCCSGRGLL